MRAAGAKLFFLPPPSPDLNRIEQMFAKLKTLFRRAAERTVEALGKRIGIPPGEVTALKRASYVRNSGHVPS